MRARHSTTGVLWQRGEGNVKQVGSRLHVAYLWKSNACRYIMSRGAMRQLPCHDDVTMRWTRLLRQPGGNQAKTIVFLAKNSGQVDKAIQEILQSIKNGDI